MPTHSNFKRGDIFDFNGLTDSGIAAGTRDLLEDFAEGTDRIDLSDIDANTNLAGNQAFTFIGTDPFTRVAGELHCEQNSAGNIVVAGDVDGNGSPDFQIVLKGLHTLAAGDFVL